jgi:hypothetical protein
MIQSADDERGGAMANQLFGYLSTISEHRAAIEAALPANDQEAFFREIEQLSVAARDDPAAEQDHWQRLIALLDRHPHARTVLPSIDLAPPPPPPPPPNAAAPAPGPVPTSTTSRGPDPTPRAAPQGAAAADSERRPPAAGPPQTPVPVPGARSSIALQWTREIITAVIAAVIVGGTIWIAYRAVSSVGTQTEAAAIKDLLTIMLGPLGVVIGYYFGKVPAESQAAEATRRADAAITDRVEVRAKVQQVASDLDRVERTQLAGAAARGEAAPTSQELQAIRDRLRAI